MFPKQDCKHRLFDYEIEKEISIQEMVQKRLAKPLQHSGLGLDDFILERIRVNDMPVNMTHKLEEKDVLSYLHLETDEAFQNLKLTVLYEDDDIIAIDKPNAISVTPSISTFFSCIVFVARRQFKNKKISPIHRLDMDTTGVLLLSKHSEAAKNFNQLGKDEFKKIYKAMVTGEFPTSIEKISGSIVRDESSDIYSKFKLVQDGSEESITNVINVKQNRSFSEVTLHLETGKTNQIRVHLASLGFPIVGDKKYFPDESVYLNWYEYGKEDDQMLIPHMALHAASIEFTHPRTGEQVVVESKDREYNEKRMKIIQSSFK